MELRCVECGRLHPPALLYACEACGGILEVMGESGLAVPASVRGMWRHGAHLGITDASAIVSLEEGDTPLHVASRAAAAIPGFRGMLWVKDETRNPTGSFKDRLVSAAISKARELGAKGVVCASSGNAGASVAAYAARAGMPAIIVVPAHTPDGKMTQIAAYGARLLKMPGHYSRSYDLAMALARRNGFANLTTTFLNPWAVDALKLVGLELMQQLEGQAPTHVLVPTGSGPLVKGVVQGFAEFGGGAVPRAVAVQAAGCAPIVRAFEQGAGEVEAWDAPNTIASGISDPLIGYAGDGTYTLRLVRQTGGVAVAVEDEEIRAAMRLLAQQEGLYAEPTGASPIAALAKLLAEGAIPPDARVVCLMTGHGFKDAALWRSMPADAHEVADLAAAEALLGATVSGA
ncbi:threonine synthase [Acetobacteraceae bacterium AT-5844]|nr:threonine synthase [Acetobacteraceae bacterium AT-5844]